jgi:hypothetical protein
MSQLFAHKLTAECQGVKEIRVNIFWQRIGMFHKVTAQHAVRHTS